MTRSQGLQKTRFKPLTIAIRSILFSTFTVFAINPIVQAGGTTTATGSISSSMTQPVNQTTGTASSNNTATDSSTQPTTTTNQAQIDVMKDSNAAATQATDSSANAPLNQPNMSDSALLSWAEDAAISTYSYDFKNFTKQMQDNQKNFTSLGWQAFMSALDKSNNLKVVESRKLVASATTTGKSTLVKEGVRNGVYAWKVQVPMLATYESESKLIKQNLMINMLIVRTSTPPGVAISHFVAVVVPSGQPVATTTTGSTAGTAGSTLGTPSGTATSPSSIYDNTTTAPTPTGTATTTPSNPGTSSSSATTGTTTGTTPTATGTTTTPNTSTDAAGTDTAGTTSSTDSIGTTGAGAR